MHRCFCRNPPPRQFERRLCHLARLRAELVLLGRTTTRCAIVQVRCRETAAAESVARRDRLPTSSLPSLTVSWAMRGQWATCTRASSSIIEVGIGQNDPNPGARPRPCSSAARLLEQQLDIATVEARCCLLALDLATAARLSPRARPRRHGEDNKEEVTKALASAETVGKWRSRGDGGIVYMQHVCELYFQPHISKNILTFMNTYL